MEKNQSKIESTSFSFFHPSSGFLRGKEEFSGLVDERVDVDVRQLRNRQRREKKTKRRTCLLQPPGNARFHDKKEQREEKGAHQEEILFDFVRVLHVQELVLELEQD